MLTSKETLIMVVYYFLKKVFGTSAQVRKLMELDILGRLSGRFPGATGHLKRQPVFPQGMLSTEIRIPVLQSHL